MIKNLPKTIDSRWLVEHSACEEQIEIFKQEWPEGALVTRENLSRAIKIGLDLEWLIKKLMAFLSYERYKAKRSVFYEAHETKLEPVFTSYQERITPIDINYKTRKKSLDTEYEAEMALSDSSDLVKNNLMNLEYQNAITLLYTKFHADVELLNAEYRVRNIPLHEKYQADIDELILNTLLEAYKN